MDKTTQREYEEQEALSAEEQFRQERFAQSLVPPNIPPPEDVSFMKDLLKNVELIDALEHNLKGEFWNGEEYIQKYPPLLTNAGINGILAVAQPISDKSNALSYYDEDDILEIMYHFMFEIDEFLLEKWKEIGLVENPDLPLIRIGNGHYQLKPKVPNAPLDKDQEYYLKNISDYEVFEPKPNLPHYNLVRGIVRRLAYATIRKSYRGLLMKTMKTQVSVLESSRTSDFAKRGGGGVDLLKKIPIFR